MTGTTAANALAAEADVVLAVGTRLQDFTTGSRTLFRAPGHRIVSLNVQAFDAGKHGAQPLVADAKAGLDGAGEALPDWRAPEAWVERARVEKQRWQRSRVRVHRRRERRACNGRAGDRRGAAASLAIRHCRLRGRRVAG